MKDNGWKKRVELVEQEMQELRRMHLELVKSNIEQNNRMAGFEERMAASDQRWIEMWKYAFEQQRKSDERFQKNEQILMDLYKHLPEALQKVIGFQAQKP